MIRTNLERPVVTPPLALLQAVLHGGSPDQPRRNSPGAGAADRFCAWAGRSGRRYVFSVFGLGPEAALAAVPLAPRAIALLVRLPAMGPRRVLWAERIEDEEEVSAVRRALARQASPEAREIHLHVVSAEAEARRAAFADLAFPRLDPAAPMNGRFRLAG